MKQDEARKAAIKDWMELPVVERQMDDQAAAFAMKIKDRYPFKCSGDRYQVVKGWLQNHLRMRSRTN